MQSTGRHFLSQLPAVPSRLWLTAGGIGLAGLSLLCEQEVWRAHPQAEYWTWVALMLLVLAGGVQTIGMLLRWPAQYAGPRWLRFVVVCVTLAAGVGVALITLLLAFISGLRVVVLGAG